SKHLKKGRATRPRGAVIPACGGATPISPPAGPTQWLFQGPPAESKVLAAADSGRELANPAFVSLDPPPQNL
ncbi:MAG: hypothetical protein ACK5AA_03770, partial [Akkermansiaceae bacterium]